MKPDELLSDHYNEEGQRKALKKVEITPANNTIKPSDEEDTQGCGVCNTCVHC